jgi:hypothetical protein
MEAIKLNPIEELKKFYNTFYIKDYQVKKRDLEIFKDTNFYCPLFNKAIELIKDNPNVINNIVMFIKRKAEKEYFEIFLELLEKRVFVKDKNIQTQENPKLKDFFINLFEKFSFMEINDILKSIKQQEIKEKIYNLYKIYYNFKTVEFNSLISQLFYNEYKNKFFEEIKKIEKKRKTNKEWEEIFYNLEKRIFNGKTEYNVSSPLQEQSTVFS